MWTLVTHPKFYLHFFKKGECFLVLLMLKISKIKHRREKTTLSVTQRAGPPSSLMAPSHSAML